MGGVVRDWLLGRESGGDVDLVVEGDGPALARELAGALGARLVSHPRFLTATLLLSDGHELDVATARTEAYPHPGSLPVVRAGTLAEDLWRRDFSINSMAARLGPDGLGELTDPTGGRSDLEAGVVRALHPRSFADDPTRMFRAVRFEQRFGFAIEPQTEGWIASALEGGALSSVSAERLRNELLIVEDEAFPARSMLRLQALGILPTMGFPARTSARRSAFWEAVPRGAWSQALVFEEPPERRARLWKRYRIAETAKALWPDLMRRLSRPLAPSRLRSLLEKLTSSELNALQARLERFPGAHARLLDGRKLLATQPLLNGKALMAHGLRPGPDFSKWLRRAFDAQLDEGWSAMAQAEAWLQKEL